MNSARAENLELWISRSMFDFHFLLISRLILSQVCINKSVYNSRSEKPENLKLCAPFNERTHVGKTKYGNPKREKMSGLRRKLKVSTSYIQIDQSG